MKKRVAVVGKVTVSMDGPPDQLPLVPSEKNSALAWPQGLSIEHAVAARTREREAWESRFKHVNAANNWLMLIRLRAKTER